jgi:large subunit ribosomal protein L31
LKENIHPKYVEAEAACACGEKFTTRSTIPKLHVDICSVCHPFFTGKQKLMDTEGRVEKFKKKYAKMQKQQEEK